MTGIDQALEQFIEAWTSGRRPDVAAYLERVPADERDDLAQAIEFYLDVAPTPDYDDATRAEIAADPILVAALRAGQEADELAWPARLREAREAADLELAAVAHEVAAAVELPQDEQRIATYLQQAEADELDERRVSRRLIEALADVLRTTKAAIAPTWAPAAPAAMFARAEEGAIDEGKLHAAFDLLGRAASTPAPKALDEVDRLFLGGPEG